MFLRIQMKMNCGFCRFHFMNQFIMGIIRLMTLTFFGGQGLGLGLSVVKNGRRTVNEDCVVHIVTTVAMSIVMVNCILNGLGMRQNGSAAILEMLNIMSHMIGKLSVNTAIIIVVAARGMDLWEIIQMKDSKS